MRGTHHVTVEIDSESSLEFEIEYKAIPAERPSPPDAINGSWSPGHPPDAELISVRVNRCDWGESQWKRDQSMYWKILDAIIYHFIQDRWKFYRQGCLEDAADREEDNRY